MATVGERLVLPLCPRCAGHAELVPDVVVRPLAQRLARRPA
ncbi:MAG: hypothetical protein ACT4RN_17620 [Pseudonocardia sp.]